MFLHHTTKGHLMPLPDYHGELSAAVWDCSDHELLLAVNDSGEDQSGRECGIQVPPARRGRGAVVGLHFSVLLHQAAAAHMWLVA